MIVFPFGEIVRQRYRHQDDMTGASTDEVGVVDRIDKQVGEHS